jgi:hypothetical protein
MLQRRYLTTPLLFDNTIISHNSNKLKVFLLSFCEKMRAKTEVGINPRH